MSLKTYLTQLASMTPAARAQLFQSDRPLVEYLATHMPSGKLRDAFNKMMTPAGTVPLKYATGDLMADLETLGYGDPADKLRDILARIAIGIVKPDDIIDMHPYINQYYFKPLKIDLNTLYEP